jgi:hypothetical protein
MDEQAQPRLIRKIGFGYRHDFMPAPLLVGYHQFAKKIQQAKFNIRVALVPLRDVNSEWDILLVPKELEIEATQLVPAERIFALTEFANQPVYAELLRRLEEGTRICAPRISESVETVVIVRYRGYERID